MEHYQRRPFVWAASLTIAYYYALMLVSLCQYGLEYSQPRCAAAANVDEGALFSRWTIDGIAFGLTLQIFVALGGAFIVRRWTQLLRRPWTMIIWLIVTTVVLDVVGAWLMRLRSPHTSVCDAYSRWYRHDLDTIETLCAVLCLTAGAIAAYLGTRPPHHIT